MQRISVVLPDPDGPSRPVIVPQATRTETSCRARRLPRMTRSWSMMTAGSAPSRVIHHLMKSSCDEYPPVVRVCQGPVHNRL